MSNQLSEIIREINHFKRQLADLLETTQQVDAEILMVADHLDRLFNEHDRLLQ